MKGYKAFDPGWKCRDFQYEIGKTYELPEGQELKICKCGFHFCKNPIDVFAYYDYEGDTLIAEVEALGNIQQVGIKFVTDKIKIVREFTRDELENLIGDDHWNNTGIENTGAFNSGNGNTGNYNSGNYNTGDYNAGTSNTGINNIGSGNSGNDNTGSFNTGSHNNGCYNSGHHNNGWRNCGDYNNGDANIGNKNTGDYNIGDNNTGHYNIGYFNAGNCNIGIFNTAEPAIYVFNKPTNIKLPELEDNYFSLFDRISNNTLIDGDIELIKSLPNFDAKIFLEITGIDLTEDK